MHIKKEHKNFLLKDLISISVFELIYLFVVPTIINYYLNKPETPNSLVQNDNINIECTKAKLKTHILPYLSFNADNLLISEKENGHPFLVADNPYIKISILPLLKSKINFKNINSDNLEINLTRDKDGILNIENLFPKKKHQFYVIHYGSLISNIKSYSININDEFKGKSANIQGNGLYFKNMWKKKLCNIKTVGEISGFASKNSSFDIDLAYNYSNNYKNLDKSILSGHITAYDIDLTSIYSYIKPLIDEKITNISGYINYLQLSAEHNKYNHISLNTQFTDVNAALNGWQTNIFAQGENIVDASVDLYKNIININSFKYLADKVNIKGNGNIITKETPVLDIEVEVKDSLCEKIVPLLPPNLVPEFKTFEKIKTYKVYGDINGKAKIRGKVPKPNVTGWVKGRNVHILDKALHKLHKGTVDIVFDNDKLNMDILIEMFNNQKAVIKGTTYMYRNGINDVTIKTTNRVDFPLAQKIVIPVSKVLNFMLGPIPDMDIKAGKGIIDLRIRGSLDFIDIKGVCSFDGARLTYNGLYADIYNGKGRLDFKDDIIYFKSDKAYVKNNFVDIKGNVKINDNLDYDITSKNIEAKDLLELINKSSLLKDVQQGLAIITGANGKMDVGMNITAKIVPVPFGQPPLPPEEAFEDMKVNGSAVLKGTNATIYGFNTPINDLKGTVDFTETTTTINPLNATCLKSPIVISGKVINDLKTKIPDVDIKVTSDAVYFSDTVQFLTESYLYPQNYPNLSSLYNLTSMHDLYFKYKAKSKDFLTNKAVAEMNFIEDISNSPLKAKNGKIVMKNSNVYVENINADLLGSNLNIDGNVKKIDTLFPLYNLDIKTENFDLDYLNNSNEYDILPEEAKNVISQFENFKGFADILIKLRKSVIDGTVSLCKPSFIHKSTSIPFILDDFVINIKNDKVEAENVTAYIGDMPFFGNIKLSNIYKIPNTVSNFTLKLTDNFVSDYLPQKLSDKINVVGDINLSADIKGCFDNLNIIPKITFNRDADIEIDNISLGETNDKREFTGNINLTPKQINIKNFDFIKYIASQNNNIYPVLFATGGGIFDIDKEKQSYIPKEIRLKTEKNLTAKLLNVFLKKPVFTQGSLSCDLKYTQDNKNKIAKLQGKLDAKNVDIPLFDTVLKNIKLETKDDSIDVNLFGFLNESVIRLSSSIENNLYSTPKIQSFTFFSDQVDNEKMLHSVTKARKAMLTNNEVKNVDFSKFNIQNANIDIKKLIIKSLVAENVKGKFSINEEGVFNVENLTLDIGEGNIAGKLKYDLSSTEFEGNFELENVDSNYVAENLLDSRNQIFGNANGKIIFASKGSTDQEIIENLSGFILFQITDGRMPKLGSLEYLLRAGNVLKNGITGLTINSVLGLLNLVKTGYFSDIHGNCIIENGIAKDIEVFSTGENLSLYMYGNYDIAKNDADMEVLGKISNRISTIFGKLGNTSLNTFFRLIPGISLLDFGKKDVIENVEKIPSFTYGDYDARVFQAIIKGDINSSHYVQSFKWVKTGRAGI